MNDAESLLLQGKFSKVAERFVDTAVSEVVPRDVPWIIGALVFLGRVEEANLFHALNRAVHREPALVCASFFLAVGEVRGGRPLVARRMFAENLLRLRRLAQREATRKTPSDGILAARFFAWQGVSFFREMSCLYRRGLFASRRAYDAAFLWGTPFARSLAADTRAHLLVRVGRVSEGLKMIAWAQEFAAAQGVGWLAGAFGVSRLNFEAQHGRDPHGALARLVAYRDALSVQDCYSRASINVELARQYLLRGRGTHARACLDDAEPFLEAHSQRRQKASLWHARASLEFHSGAFEVSMRCLEHAESAIDSAIDIRRNVEVLGLRRRCLEECGSPVPGALAAQIEDLTRRTGSRIAANVLARHAGNVTDAGGEDDPLGSLLDRVEREFREGGLRRESQRLVGDVLAQGYLGLLPRMLGLSPGARAVVLDVVQGAVLAIDGADVRYEPNGSSAQVRSFLLALARSPHSKQQLVEWLWGYRYDSERHDPLVYALVRRVRRLLGANEDWVRAQGGRYFLKEGVAVRVHEPGGSSPVPEPEPLAVRRNSDAAPVVAASLRSAPAVHTASRLVGLNHRQVLFLEWIATHRFASVADLMQAFAVSKATASRDLAALVEAGHLVRSGQARATRYSLL